MHSPSPFRYRCTSCGAHMSEYSQFEEWQHSAGDGACGGLVVDDDPVGDSLERLSRIRAALAEAGWHGGDLAEGVRFLGRVKAAAMAHVRKAHSWGCTAPDERCDCGHDALVEALKESP